MALLLTLRANLSLLRLQEARRAWGALVLHAREAAGLSVTYLPDDASDAVCRHLSVLGWSLKATLRGEDDGDAIDGMLSPEDATRVRAARKRDTSCSIRSRRRRCNEIQDRW